MSFCFTLVPHIKTRLIHFRVNYITTIAAPPLFMTLFSSINRKLRMTKMGSGWNQIGDTVLRICHVYVIAKHPIPKPWVSILQQSLLCWENFPLDFETIRSHSPARALVRSSAWCYDLARSCCYCSSQQCHMGLRSGP